MRKLRPALLWIFILTIGIGVPASILRAEPIVFAQSFGQIPTPKPHLKAAEFSAAQLDQPSFAAEPTLQPLPTELPTQPAVEAVYSIFPASNPIPSSTVEYSPALQNAPAWEPVPFDTCMKLALPPCLNEETIQLPPAPEGFVWKRLDGAYTFSAYAHPSEDYFMGDQLDIPGVPNLSAKEGFLFGVDGIGMQGGGYIWRKDAENQLAPIYIRYIDGHWELGGQNVVISDDWRFEESGTPVDLRLIGNIRLADAKFAMVPEPNLTPYYSVAASPRFPIGTKLYVPGLSQFGGTFEVQDRGGAFGPDSHRFDIYVGKDMTAALQFIRLGAARSNLAVYALEPE